MNHNLFLSHKQVVDLIKNVGPYRTVLVLGENGIGKTSIAHTLNQDPDFDNHIKVDPIDCTQLNDGSLFMPDLDRERGVSTELPNERLGVGKHNHKGIEGARPVLGMFDEVAKVPQFVKNMIAPMIYDRRVGKYKWPEGSVWFAGSNLGVEGLGDLIQAHLRSRQVVVYMRKPNAPEWINNFAIPRGLNPILIACVEENPAVLDSFIDYLPGGKYAGRDMEKDNPMPFNPKITQDSYASPRTLHAASDILNIMDKIDSDTLRAALVGTVGMAFASVLDSFIRFGKQLPPIRDVRANPDTAPISSNKIAQQVQVFQFLTRVQDRDDAQAFTKYVLRLQPEMQTLFVRRACDSSHVGLFTTVEEFSKLMADNKIYFRAS